MMDSDFELTTFHGFREREMLLLEPASAPEVFCPYRNYPARKVRATANREIKPYEQTTDSRE